MKLINLGVAAVLFWGAVQAVTAGTTTALYKVDSVVRVVKTEKPACDEEQGETCEEVQRSYWKVTYKAVSRYARVQEHELEVADSPPQIGGITQLTVTFDDD